MAFVQLADGELQYQVDGNVDAPVLVLSNSLGTNLHMWGRDHMPLTSAISLSIYRLELLGLAKSIP